MESRGRLALDPAKSLDINAIEPALDNLLEHYRQALRAVELLPGHGRVPNNELIVQIGRPVDTKRRRLLAVRRLARMFLRSHIRSKLRTITDRLEVERLASGHMDVNTLKRLDDIIGKLRDYDKSVFQRRTFWSELPGWLWPVAAPILFTALYKYLATLTVTAAGVLVYIAIYLLFFVAFVWFPLYLYLALGGFRWKRLILLGQIGDVNIDIVPNAILRWMRGPQANTYESENSFFATLGLPKPDEFPWDRVLEPPLFLSSALVLSFFMVALAVSIPAKEFSWPLLIIDVIFIAFLLLYLRFIVRPISRDMRGRKQRQAC
ncbi:MAG: hypothetical protein MUO80_00560 [Dehalococcoidia bacterium]|nr:hypothetical protein [Dehalococcoidia bacterium]